jgi:carboxylesterase
MLSLKHKVSGIVAMGMPLRFRFDALLRLYTRIASKFSDFQKKYYPPKDMHVVRKKVHYTVIPLPKFKDLFFIIEKTRKALPRINLPVLIMQSSTDGTMRAGNAKSIYNKLGSQSKKLVFIPNSYHVFVMDRNKRIAFREILDFLEH